MKNVITMTLAALLAAAIAPSSGTLNAAPLATHITAGTVKVTVTYKGKGTVDSLAQAVGVAVRHAEHRSRLDADRAGLARQERHRRGVRGVVGDKVYIAVAFDEQGAMMGDAPPPAGSPIGVLAGKDGAPSAVTPGDKGAATLTFDDSFRMP